MKKIFSILGAVALLASCNDNTVDGYTISGEVKGVEDGTQVILKKQVGMDYQSLDTTEVKAGKFELKGLTDEVGLSALTFGSDDVSIPLVLENGKIKVNFNAESLDESKVSGTKNNDAFNSFNENVVKLRKDIQDFQQNANSLFEEARNTNNSTVMDSLLAINDEKMEKLNNYNKTFVKENNDSYIAALLLSQMTQGGVVETEEAQELLANFSEEAKNYTPSKELSEFLGKIAKVSIGQKAPDFSAPSPEGKEISLKESLGKVTIIDFWASWCTPCRIENPNVVRIYNKYHDQGLNIIGVSLDRDGDSWKQAIEKDQLTWTHISHLQYWNDPIAKEYSVRGIPATFILDENGVIVAKDLRGDELEKKIAELLQ